MRRLAAGLVLALLGAPPLAAQQAPPMVPGNAQGQPQGGDARSGEPGVAVPLPSQTVVGPAKSAGLIAPILTVDQDLLFQQSAWGHRVQAQLEAEGETIRQENDRLAQQLSDEEAVLTEQRKTLEPAEFRQKADAFDAKATEVRRERAQAVTDLNARAEADRTAFYKAALPIMAQMMQDRGAVAVLDRRSVFVSAEAIDITQPLIAQLDAAIGDGSDQPTATTPAPAAPAN